MLLRAAFVAVALAASGGAAIEDAAGKPKSHVSYYYEPDSQEKVAAVERYAETSPEMTMFGRLILDVI